MANELLRLMPAPQSMTMSGGALSGDRLNVITILGEDIPTEETGFLIEEIAEICGASPERVSEGAGLTIDLRSEGVEGRGDESYRLSIGEDGVILTGSTHRAAYYGLQTLRQVLACSGPELPALMIEDWPRYGFRGYSDDISRRQVSTLRDFEFLIKNLSQMKANVYQPYMEDMIFIDRHPMMGSDRGRLTRDEVAYLVELGRRYFVDIMPQFNSICHQERMLELPEFAPWRFEGNRENLDPRLPEVRSFLKDVYQQLFEQFPFEYFHMGLDEARGLGFHKELYIDAANWLAEMVLEAGKKPVMWHDMFVPYHDAYSSYSAKDLDSLNREIILDQWVYHATGERAEFMEEILSRGFKVLLSPCLHSGCCGSGTDFQWTHTAGFLKHDRGSDQVLGINDTTWNGDGVMDKHLNWRGLAASSYMMWHGARPVEERRGVMAAFNAHFYGITDAEGNEQLEQIADFGVANSSYYNSARAAARTLAQTTSNEQADKASQVLSETHQLMQRLNSLKQNASQNADHLDHMLHGLERIEVGARRIIAAPAMQAAIDSGDTAAVRKLAEDASEQIAELNSRFVEVWLTTHKPEGLEYAIRPFRNILSELENLPWQLAHTARRFKTLCDRGFAPVDISSVTTSQPMELAPLPWGNQIFDTVPWMIARPRDNDGKSIILLRSKNFADVPDSVSIQVGAAGRVLHLLHAVHGEDQESAVGVYRIRYVDGSVQEFPVSTPQHICNWWMPFGHVFGGGGALRIDTDCCRLAYCTGDDYLQGHCLYHCWIPLEKTGVEISSIEVVSGSDAVSMVVAAMTIEMS